MLFPGDWFIESTGERSILDQKKVVTEFNRLQADNRRWSKVADERSMQNTALRQENERLKEALASCESWIDRWTGHIGVCEGGDKCTCGRSAILYEARAALEPSRVEQTFDGEKR